MVYYITVNYLRKMEYSFMRLSAQNDFFGQWVVLAIVIQDITGGLKFPNGHNGIMGSILCNYFG